ncbi:hypothetical protein [Phreatobacter sp.]|uniref:hypothetical protein n=1 Tax=Phreatobacter sp. TaxID=1966341 RepID=UPI003F6E870D
MTRTAVFLCLTLAAATPAAAQITGPSPAPAPPAQAPQGPAAAPGNVTAPGLEAHRARRLDELYSRLRDAETPAQARVLEREIAATLARTDSDTTLLLMVRATQAAQMQQPDLALSLLETIIDLYPGYVEAWSRRAMVHMSRNEYGRAMSDIEHVLRLEPRHYSVMVGLGMMLQQIGQETRALTVFRKVLEINPHAERIPDIIRRLEPKVDGQRL